MPTLFAAALFATALLLILLIMVQRGRGGGIVAALGGPGGHSVFGTRAGTTFTWVTVATAVLWIGLCVVAVKVLGGLSFAAS
jgi:preprotein translocase subunit SecG